MNAPQGTPLTILAIDDEPEVLDRIASIAVEAGYCCRCARDAQSATQAMQDVAGTPSVTDSAGNAYTLDNSARVVGSVRNYVFSAHDVTALVAGNTITVTHASVAARAVSAI